MRYLIAAIAGVMALVLLPGLALADAAGTAKGVNPAAEAARDGAIRTLVVGADIFLGDRVDTGPSGQVQILFSDRTKLVVGPKSSLVIDDYLLRNDGSAGKFVVDMLSGTFRFATGDSAKNRYQLNTPTGTIGIRGTGFDAFVGPQGDTWLMLYHGGLRFCSLSGQCDEISTQCEVGVYTAADARVLGDARKTVGALRDMLKVQFRYAENEAPLLRQFRIAQAFDCLHRRPNVPVIEKKSDASTPEEPKRCYRCTFRSRQIN